MEQTHTRRQKTGDNRLLTVKEVAAWLGVCQNKVYGLKDARIIPHCKIGGSIKFKVEDVKSYLDRVRVE